ncbi:MAG TPA: IPT/TIG domain-containing protein [Oculatellaceae cyanobacterium]
MLQKSFVYSLIGDLSLFCAIAFCALPSFAADSGVVTLDESSLFVAPNAGLQNFSQTINLKKGQDKLALRLTYYNGTETAPSFKVLRISSPTMNFVTEQQFGSSKTLSLDASGELTWGGLQLMIQAEGPKGAAFGWRVTTPKPEVLSVYPTSAGPGEAVTLTGNNFCISPAANVVLVDGKPAQCIDANSKRIVVKLPEDLTSTGEIVGSVQVAGIDAGKFKLSMDAVPAITGLGGNFTPIAGAAGWIPPTYPVTILGRNFSPSATDMKVTIGPFDCAVTSATVNSVTVSAPAGFAGNPWGVHQPVKVWVRGVRAQGSLFVSIYNTFGI